MRHPRDLLQTGQRVLEGDPALPRGDDEDVGIRLDDGLGRDGAVEHRVVGGGDDVLQAGGVEDPLDRRVRAVGEEVVGRVPVVEAGGLELGEFPALLAGRRQVGLHRARIRVRLLPGVEEGPEFADVGGDRVEIREVALRLGEGVGAAARRHHARDPVVPEVVDAQVALAEGGSVDHVRLQFENAFEADGSVVLAASGGDLLDAGEAFELVLDAGAVEGAVLAESCDHPVRRSGGDDVRDSFAPRADDPRGLALDGDLLSAERGFHGVGGVGGGVVARRLAIGGGARRASREGEGRAGRCGEERGSERHGILLLSSG